MKILHLIDSEGVYGAEVMLLTLMEEQKVMGLSPVLCSIGTKNILEKPLEQEAQLRGLIVKKFRMANGPNFLGAWKIIKYAQNEHFDLMHSHGYKGNILFGFIPKRLRKIPLITTLHGWTYIGGFKKMKLYEWLDAMSLTHVDAVVVVSKAMLADLKLNYRNGMNVSVINNGIPPLDFNSFQQPAHDPVLSFCNKGFTVGSIGRLSKEKGYNFLIEALYTLVERQLDIKLVILGEGPERKSLEGLIHKLALNHTVILPGYRNRARNYIPNFDVFVLPSLTEGFPITILEAMVAGIPIVATDVGSVPEMLEYGRVGIVVKHSESQSIADAIALIYNNKTLGKELAAKAKMTSASRHSSKTMALQYSLIYEKVSHHNS